MLVPKAAEYQGGSASRCAPFLAFTAQARYGEFSPLNAARFAFAFGLFQP